MPQSYKSHGLPGDIHTQPPSHFDTGIGSNSLAAQGSIALVDSSHLAGLGLHRHKAKTARGAREERRKRPTWGSNPRQFDVNRHVTTHSNKGSPIPGLHRHRVYTYTSYSPKPGLDLKTGAISLSDVLVLRQLFSLSIVIIIAGIHPFCQRFSVGKQTQARPTNRQNERAVMSKLQITETSSVDAIQSIIKDPSIKPSDEAIKVLFSSISSSNGSVRAQALEALGLVLSRQESHGTAWFESALKSLMHSTEALEVCNGLAALAAIWSISQDHALRFIQSEGFFSRLANSVVKLAALDQSRPEEADSEWPECSDWLTGISRGTSPTSVSIPARCGAILALLKLRRSTDLQSAPKPSSDQLVDILMISFLGNKNPPNSAIESLALLSEDESVRKTLRGRSEAFFQTAKSLTQSDRDHEAGQIKFTPSRSLAFGLATVVLHLVSFKVLTNEFPADDKAREKQEHRRHRMLLAERDYYGFHAPQEDRENEKYDRGVLPWLRSTLERNSDFIQTLAWLSKTGDASPQLKATITKVWLNLVEYDNCATLASESGGLEIVLDILNTPKFSGYLSQQQSPGTPASETNAMSTLGSLVLDPHELEMIQVLAKLNAFYSSDEDHQRTMVKLLTILFLHPSSTKFQTYLALTALSSVIRSEGATAEVLGCSQLLDRLDQLVVSEFSREILEVIDSLIAQPAYFKRFAPPSPADSNQTDITYITRLQDLISLINHKEVKVSCQAASVFHILVQASPEVGQAIVSDHSLTESLLKTFKIWANGDRDSDGYYLSTSENMRAAFQAIYDNLPCPSEGDPPALFVDDRLHYGLMQIDDFCDQGMEHGDYKDCRDLRVDIASLSKCIVEQFHSRKKFEHFDLHN
ncbi:hypothetical protein PtA15_6A526 [Puccinia triticina]|uniref:Uncharacterized protein n=1 Tax=Puccinia triticina TaxID=208348 RepID=A0ABY7CN31_9BASI|nr:uncharacterized protein PtA15_6A526 [Puccinia triticina]WAQ85897.1 hypothetical protein PtA15_6A526 [Puccinia triticina]